MSQIATKTTFLFTNVKRFKRSFAAALFYTKL